MSKKKQKKNIKSEQKIHIKSTDVAEILESNYMPYTMSVIVSRALPEIDGLKPSHRKLLYTMYKMGLLKGNKTKCANIIGNVMQLNPHGDSSIYETMVRLARGNESLLLPYVDSKGNFGKVYSKNMVYAAYRYTEAKLDPIMQEFFEDIDKGVVQFVDNYDSTKKEPLLLPVTFPSILANPNMGIAVGMASNICGFNLIELCEATIAILNERKSKRNPKVTTDVLLDILKAPDFSTGGRLVYNRDSLKQIYETGKGSIYLRANYKYDPKANCVDIYEIPYTTNIEAIVDSITELVKTNQIKDLTDIRDESDKDGLKITLDLKRNTDVEQLMARLFLTTPLESSFSANFNIIHEGRPYTLGVKEILDRWIDFRIDCVKKQIDFDLEKNNKRLHILKGLETVLVDLDKAVKIVRATSKEKEVVSNLMTAFKIDEEQATYVAEIKLRNFNKEYILNRTKDIATVEKDISRLEKDLNSETRTINIIIKQLEDVSKKYGQPRKTQIVAEKKVKIEDTEELFIDDYNVKIFVTNEGYIKKVPLTSMRGAGENNLKDEDYLVQELDGTNKSDLLFFTNNHIVYKLKTYELEDSKLSQLGEYIPNVLKLPKDEEVIQIINTEDYSGSLLAFFENGKCARIAIKGYETKTNRKQLKNAYGKSSKLVRMFYVPEGEDIDVILVSSIDKLVLMNTSRINVNNMKTSQGVGVMKGAKSDKDFKVEKVHNLDELKGDYEYYRVAGSTAAVGKFLRKEDSI